MGEALRQLHVPIRILMQQVMFQRHRSKNLKTDSGRSRGPFSTNTARRRTAENAWTGLKVADQLELTRASAELALSECCAIIPYSGLGFSTATCERREATDFLAEPLPLNMQLLKPMPVI